MSILQMTADEAAKVLADSAFDSWRLGERFLGVFGSLGGEGVEV